jgi:hypothetical protein
MIQAVFICDGKFDQCLEPIIELTARANQIALQIEMIQDISEHKWSKATALAPDLLLVHRDAEAQDPALRRREIGNKVQTGTPWVPIVPVRMTEAWLLVQESAIRQASGNRNGPGIEMPAFKQIERIADPKERLKKLLEQASGLKGRRLERLKREFGDNQRRVAALITDLAALRRLPSFEQFEGDLCSACQDLRNRLAT